MQRKSKAQAVRDARLREYGPHAKAAFDAGGKLFSFKFDRGAWDRKMAEFKPGCGRPIHVAGTNGGTMPCGAKLGGKQQFCGDCQPRQESAMDLANQRRLEYVEQRLAFLSREIDRLDSTGQPIKSLTDEFAELEAEKSGLTAGMDFLRIMRDGKTAGRVVDALLA